MSIGDAAGAARSGLFSDKFDALSGYADILLKQVEAMDYEAEVVAQSPLIDGFFQLPLELQVLDHKAIRLKQLKEVKEQLSAACTLFYEVLSETEVLDDH